MKFFLVTLTSNGVEEKIMERFWEIKGLKDHLQYITLKKEYVSNETACFIDIKKKKVEYVL
jgi:hypothetical protein